MLGTCGRSLGRSQTFHSRTRVPSEGHTGAGMSIFLCSLDMHVMFIGVSLGLYKEGFLRAEERTLMMLLLLIRWLLGLTREGVNMGPILMMLCNLLYLFISHRPCSSSLGCLMRLGCKDPDTDKSNALFCTESCALAAASPKRYLYVHQSCERAPLSDASASCASQVLGKKKKPVRSFLDV